MAIAGSPLLKSGHGFVGIRGIGQHQHTGLGKAAQQAGHIGQHAGRAVGIHMQPDQGLPDLGIQCGTFPEYRGFGTSLLPIRQQADPCRNEDIAHDVVIVP